MTTTTTRSPIALITGFDAMRVADPADGMCVRNARVPRPRPCISLTLSKHVVSPRRGRVPLAPARWSAPDIVVRLAHKRRAPVQAGRTGASHSGSVNVPVYDRRKYSSVWVSHMLFCTHSPHSHAHMRVLAVQTAGEDPAKLPPSYASQSYVQMSTLPSSP